MSVQVTYRMPQMGLGTDFSEFDRPINFATTYTNRFRNITGGAERRPGMAFATSGSVPTNPNLTRLHEYVDQLGNETLFASDDFGNIYKYGIISSGYSTGGVNSLTITNPGSGTSLNGSFVGESLSNLSSNGNGITINFSTGASGQITSINAITVQGSAYVIGDTLNFTAFGEIGNIFTVNSLVNASASPNQFGWSIALTGKSNARMISAEADNKLIFVNGTDRNFYTDDAGTTFKELKSIINQGVLAGISSASTVVDGNVSNWIGATLVSNNDIIYNVTKNAYGIVTVVASASLTITPIGSAGTGATGAGLVANNQGPGDAYQLIDYVDLTIIPDGSGINDNVGTMTVGTTSTVVAVSGVNFANTEMRTGDIAYNTTRGGIALIGSVSANFNLQQAVSGQIAGDALALFKSAMPISSWIHVHYGRCAYLDARNGQRIVFSAPDDPQDVTTFQKTLDSASFSFGTQQPNADVMLSMRTFLSYFVAAGEKNLYIYQGNTPIQDASGDALNFTPIAFYPNGIAGRFGLETNGGDLLHITVDGLQAINIGFNAFSVNQNNASVPILNTLKGAINAVADTDNIQLTYYPRRRWLINKIGDQCYILNTQPSYDQTGAQQQIASWHLYTGPWAQQNHYFVRRNGDLLACGANGGVYLMDASAPTDVGTAISTDLTTAWLRLEEPQITPRIKEGHFIRPVFESSPDVEYTISVRAGLDNFSSDSITVSAGGTGAIGTAIIGTTPIGGGSFAQTTKYPLRWRGEQARIEFTSESSASEDIITSYTVYGNVAGIR